MITPSPQVIEAAEAAVDEAMKTDKLFDGSAATIIRVALTVAAPIVAAQAKADALKEEVEALEIRLGEMDKPADRDEDQFLEGFAAAAALLDLHASAATAEGQNR